MEEVSKTGHGPIVTNQGTSIEADCVFNCMGLKVNSDLYADSLGEEFFFITTLSIFVEQM